MPSPLLQVVTEVNDPYGVKQTFVITPTVKAETQAQFACPTVSSQPSAASPALCDCTALAGRTRSRLMLCWAHPRAGHWSRPGE
jgi:hypothetical protein